TLSLDGSTAVTTTTPTITLGITTTTLEQLLFTLVGVTAVISSNKPHDQRTHQRIFMVCWSAKLVILSVLDSKLDDEVFNKPNILLRSLRISSSSAQTIYIGFKTRIDYITVL
ncbi:hypothetical protein OTU49_002494, partial [Cherax quadricarinatus]